MSGKVKGILAVIVLMGIGLGARWMIHDDSAVQESYICGGLGPFLGFLPCSPHCKPEVQEDNELNGDYDFYRPIIRLENYD